MTSFDGRSAQNMNTGEFTGSLRRTLIQALVALTLIPLIIMAGSAYLRSRDLLQQQAVTQMQTLLNGQTDDVVLLLKTKNIRLERLTNREDLASLLQQALHSNRKSTTFNSLRRQVLDQIRVMNADQANPTFDQVFLVRPNGTIQMATRPEWETTSIAETAAYGSLRAGKPITITVYDFRPYYPNQLVALTIQPYRTESGSVLGALVGVTEPQSLSRILDPLVRLSPSASAYFVTTDGVLIGADPYTCDLLRIEPSQEHKASLGTSFAGMMGQT